VTDYLALTDKEVVSTSILRVRLARLQSGFVVLVAMRGRGLV
jgi:hypothetical protein